MRSKITETCDLCLRLFSLVYNQECTSQSFEQTNEKIMSFLDFENMQLYFLRPSNNFIFRL